MKNLHKTILQNKAFEYLHQNGYQKDYVFPMLKMKFNQKRNLTRHINSFHDKITIFECETCFQTELQLAVVGSFTDPTGASAAKLTSLLSRMPAEIMNLSCQERNFSFHKMNYSDKNPFAKFDFRSKYNHVN